MHDTRTRIFTALAIVLLLAPFAIAVADTCGDIVTPGKSCTMLTPSISCTNYTYDVYNNATYLQTGNLTYIDHGIYKLEFNETPGGYIVQLCDGSTREIRVQEDDMTFALSVSLFFILFTIGIFVGAYKIPRFAKNKLVDLVIRRFLYAFGCLNVLLCAVVAAQLSNLGGLGLESEAFMVMQVLILAVLTAIVLISWFTIKDGIQINKARKERKQDGLDPDDDYDDEE